MLLSMIHMLSLSVNTSVPCLYPGLVARSPDFPQHLLRLRTERNDVATRRAELEKAQNEQLSKAQERGAKLENLKIEITQKAGVDGRLFGSVTNYDIVEALEKMGHEVERSQVRMPQGPLKQVGEYPLQIALHTDVTVTITVSVIGEQ